MGVDDEGRKYLISLEDGERESTQSWREVLLAAKAGVLNAAKLGVGDGAISPHRARRGHFFNRAPALLDAQKWQRPHLPTREHSRKG